MDKLSIYLTIISILIIILTLRIKKTDDGITIQFGLLRLLKDKKEK